jgi:hypothetical protein
MTDDDLQIVGRFRSKGKDMFLGNLALLGATYAPFWTESWDDEENAYPGQRHVPKNFTNAALHHMTYQMADEVMMMKYHGNAGVFGIGQYTNGLYIGGDLLRTQ